MGNSGSLHPTYPKSLYSALSPAAADNRVDCRRTFDSLVTVWERTRLPKGMSTAEKKYVWRQDRARHFASRRPDMTYLICDEDDLGLESYLAELKAHIAWYRETLAGEMKQQ